MAATSLVLGLAAVPLIAQTSRMSVLYDVPASIATMVDRGGGPDAGHLNLGFDNVYQQGYADATVVRGGLVAKVTTGPPSIRTPNIVGMSASALTLLLEHIIDARRTTKVPTNYAWNTTHLVFVDEIGGAERGAHGNALAAALANLSRKPARWPLPGGGLGSYARHVHVYVRTVQSMISDPTQWMPIWRALPLTGGVWLEAYNGNTLPLSAWTPEEWLAWPRAFTAEFAAVGGQVSRMHFLITGARVAGQDQASQWALARTGDNPADQQSNCTILRNGVGAYRLSASPREVEAGTPAGSIVPAAIAFVAQFRLTFPISGVAPAPDTPGGCTPSPVLSPALAAALGGSTASGPGVLFLGRSGVALGTGTVSATQVPFDQTTAITVHLPGGTDPFGIVGTLAGAGAPGLRDATTFWAAARPRLQASGAGVGAISAPFLRASDGTYAATLPVTPSVDGPIVLSLVIDGQAVRQALGPPADLALSLAPYAAGLGPVLRNVIDNPMTWLLPIPVGPTGQPGGSLVAAIYPVPAIATSPAIEIPSHNPTTWVRLTGSGFAPATTVSWNGVRLPALNQSPAHELVLVPAWLIAAQGTAQLVATNPAPGGGASVPVIVTIGPPAPATVRVRPQIAGPARLGAVLTCSPGVWSLPVTGYRFAWRRGSATIGGASAPTYTVTRADLGRTLACVVTSLHFGAVGRASSTGVRPIAALSLRIGTGSGTTRALSVVDRLPWRRATVLVEVNRGHGYHVVHAQVLGPGRATIHAPIAHGRVVVLLVARAHGQTLTSVPVTIRLR
jgi:hypothetical protein